MTIAAMEMADKKMGAAFVAGVDTSPVFDFAEHILDAMTLAIEGAVMRERDYILLNTPFGSSG